MISSESVALVGLSDVHVDFVAHRNMPIIHHSAARVLRCSTASSHTESRLPPTLHICPRKILHRAMSDCTLLDPPNSQSN